MKRWYDVNPKFAQQLEHLRTLDDSSLDKVVSEILTIIRHDQPNILDDNLLEFPLDILRRRWYDTNPYLWLIVNGLEYADTTLVNKVADCIEHYHESIR